jgi:hypothetical protein
MCNEKDVEILKMYDTYADHFLIEWFSRKKDNKYYIDSALLKEVQRVLVLRGYTEYEEYKDDPLYGQWY